MEKRNSDNVPYDITYNCRRLGGLVDNILQLLLLPIGFLFFQGSVLHRFKSFWSNFGVKARIINDRKLIRIVLIRINLRNL
jgi:hypothetical protein